MTQPLNIVVADDERDTREYLEELVGRLGHKVTAVATGRELVEQSHALRPDLIVTDIKMPDLDGIEAASVVNREGDVPVILVSAHHDAELIARTQATHIMAYLVKPVKPADVQTAIAVALARFGQYKLVRQEAATLRQALEDRKLIERAKGIVMKRGRVDEPEAFRRLQRLASDHNLKLIEIARAILTAEEVFQGKPPAREGER